MYSKYQYKFTDYLEAMVDLQYRRVNYDINGTRKAPDLKIGDRFDFFNPKFGITYSAGSLVAYASYAFANKNPTAMIMKMAGLQIRPSQSTCRISNWALKQINTITAGVSICII